MAIGINGTPGTPTTFSGTGQVHAYTISGGARRKAVGFAIYKTTTGTFSSPVFNGGAPEWTVEPTILGSDGGMRTIMFGVDLSDGLADGTYNFGITTSGSTTQGALYGWVLNDVATGAPTDSDSNDAVDPDAMANIALTNAAGAFILAGLGNTANGQTHDWTGSDASVAERHDTGTGSCRLTTADGANGAGNAAIQCVASATTNTRQMIAAAFIQNLGSAASAGAGVNREYPRGTYRGAMRGAARRVMVQVGKLWTQDKRIIRPSIADIMAVQGAR